MINNFYIAVLS